MPSFIYNFQLPLSQILFQTPDHVEDLMNPDKSDIVVAPAPQPSVYIENYGIFGCKTNLPVSLAKIW